MKTEANTSSAPIISISRSCDILIDVLSVSTADKQKMQETQLNLSSLTSPEWRETLDLAIEQRVIVWLDYRLKLCRFFDRLPAPVQQELERYHRSNIVRNFQLHRTTKEITQLLNEQGIKVLALKGMHMDACYYPISGLREMNDIDLLVTESDLQQIGLTLEQNGFIPLEPYDPTVGKVVSHQLPPFVKKGHAPIEIHWNITRRNQHYSIAENLLWVDATHITIGGERLLGLSPVDLLLHLCVHTSYQHKFEFGLRPSADLAVIIEKEGLSFDWKDLLIKAQERNWSRGTYLALKLSRELVGAAVPDQVLQQLKPENFDENIYLTARAQVFTNKSMARIFSNSQGWRNHFSSSLPLSEKVNHVLGRIFPSRSHIAASYSVPKSSVKIILYYPKRIAEKILKHFRNRVFVSKNKIEKISFEERKCELIDWLNN